MKPLAVCPVILTVCPVVLTVCVALLGCGGDADPLPAGAVEAGGAMVSPEAFQTKLVRPGPSPQDWESEPLPPNTFEIRYPSDGLQLKAWVCVPDGKQDQAHPALVFLHGGFAFGASDLADCRPFLDAGYVVMCPMFRGENGNGGHFELMCGEVNDAAAAAKWLAEQPYVDPNRIYAFGHSIGGGISALLSLRGDLPLKHCGSSGGIYGPETFDGWAEIVPFSLSDPAERQARCLVGRIRNMRLPHYAFVGTGDEGASVKSVVESEQGNPAAPLEVIVLPGDHFTSFPTAMKRYLEVIEAGR